MLFLTVTTNVERDTKLKLHNTIEEASRHLGMECAEIDDHGYIYHLTQVGTCHVQSVVEVIDAAHLAELLDSANAVEERTDDE